MRTRLTEEKIDAVENRKDRAQWQSGAPERDRTSNPQIRSLMLYPIELRTPPKTLIL